MDGMHFQGQNSSRRALRTTCGSSTCQGVGLRGQRPKAPVTGNEDMLLALSSPDSPWRLSHDRVGAGPLRHPMALPSQQLTDGTRQTDGHHHAAPPCTPRALDFAFPV